MAIMVPGGARILRRSTTSRPARALLILLLGAGQSGPFGAPAGAPLPAAGRSRIPRAVAGMTLEMKGDRVVIGAVTPDSPAAAAGLRPGDALLEVNGFPLYDLAPVSSEAALGLFEDGGDLGYHLVLGRGSDTLGVTLTMPPAGTAAGSRKAPDPPRVGGLAPDFQAGALHGEEVSLKALRGRPVLLEFWASWCPPCREQTITVRRLAEQHKEDLVIVGVSLDENRPAFEAFVYNHHLPGFQISDGGPNGPVSRLYAVAASGIPYSVLVDPDGRIVSLGASLHEKEEAIARLAASSRRARTKP